MLALKEQKQQQTSIEIPDNWEDFAPLLDIKSGSRITKFIPYKYQIVLSKLVEKYSNLVIIKTRQLGITESLLSMILHKAIKSAGFSACIFSLTKEDAKDNSTRSRLMLKSLELKTKNDNIHELALKQGGSIIYKGCAPEGSRGRVLSLIYLDEAAHNRNLEEITASSTASLTESENACKIYVSTPGNTDNFFFNEILTSNNGDHDILQICKDVADEKLYKDDIPGFYYFETDPETVKIVIHWKAIPKYYEMDKTLPQGYLKWRQIKNSLSDVVLMRDHNLQFSSGEENIFNFEIVNRALVGGWETSRKRGYRYIAGLDTNVAGSNYLAFTVLRESHENGELSLIAMYRNRKMSQEYHIYEIAQLINKFDIDKIAIESNQGGHFYWERLCQEFPDKEIKGFDTTGVSKPTLIGRLLSALERELLEMPDDPNLRKEFLNYVRIDNVFEASSGYDDLVMSLAVALQVSELATIPVRKRGFDGFSEKFLEGLWGQDA